MNKKHEQLIVAYLAGEDVAEPLLKACRNDPELLSELTDLTVIDRLLSFCGDEGSVFAAEVRKRLEIQADDTFVRNVRNQLQPNRQKKILMFARLAAAACLAVGFIYFFNGSRAELGHITTSTDATWATQTLNPGDALNKGVVELTQGYSELTLNNGVRLVLEAPVEIDLRSTDLIKVNRGRLVAKVPKPAIGFRVLTPSSEVVDLGTEFGISVDGKGSSEVHVLDGEVKARSLHQKNFTSLIKNEGMAFDEDQQVTMIQSHPALFRRALPGRSAENPHYLHWSCDGGDPLVDCDGTGIDGTLYPGEPKALDGGEGPIYQNGQFGDALYFNGQDAYVKTDFPGIGNNHPRTVAFWVKIPVEFSVNNGYGMVSWGLMKKGSAWQISPNPAPEDGPLGRLRIGTMDAPVIGTTDLRDARWHHVAIVMYGGDEADVSTHILLYVDGRLEKASQKSVARIETQLDHPSSSPLMFGRNMAFTRDSIITKERFFKGWLDEIYIFDTALEQEKIRALMQTNRLES